MFTTTSSTFFAPAPSTNYGFDYDFLMKVVMIGDSGCGKSSLLKRFTHDEFVGSYISTIGVDFEVRTMNIDSKTVKLQCWDTAGQDRFRTITTSYYRGAQAIVIVFDVTNMESFRAVPRWLDEVRRYATKDVDIVILANKCDMEKRRVVTDAHIEQLSRVMDIPVLHTSAKSAVGVTDAFETLGSRFLERQRTNPTPPAFQPISLSDQSWRKSVSVPSSDAEITGICPCNIM
jgi:Ras-related protein Rab-1A